MIFLSSVFPDDGDGEIRTLDPLLARQVLSQLSYAPLLCALRQDKYNTVYLCATHTDTLKKQLRRLNLAIGVNKIYFLIWQPPAFPCRLQHSILGRLRLNHRVRDVYGCFP